MKEYSCKNYTPAPVDKIKRSVVDAANKAGLRDYSDGDYWESYHTPVLQMAYNLGRTGTDISGFPVVRGIRYGKAPELGLSHNHADDTSESGLSLAQEYGQDEIGSSVWFCDRGAYEYRGIKIGTGSDDETIILPLHVDLLD